LAIEMVLLPRLMIATPVMSVTDPMSAHAAVATNNNDSARHFTTTPYRRCKILKLPLLETLLMLNTLSTDPLC